MQIVWSSTGAVLEVLQLRTGVLSSHGVPTRWEKSGAGLHKLSAIVRIYSRYEMNRYLPDAGSGRLLCVEMDKV